MLCSNKLFQLCHDGFSPLIHPQRIAFGDQNVAKPIDHETRQPIRFGMNQPVGLRHAIQSKRFPSQRNGLLQTIDPPDIIRTPLAGSKKADGNFGIGVKQPVSCHFAAGGNEFDQITRLSVPGILPQLLPINKRMPQTTPQPDFDSRTLFGFIGTKRSLHQ